MKLFTTFNFDIIIIIIAFFGVVIGIYRGLYTQLKKTASLTIPLIILYFLLPVISKNAISNDKFVNFVKLFLFSKLEAHIYLIINLFIGIILYIGFAIIIYLIFNLFQKKDINYYLLNKKTIGRVIAPFISLLSSYIIVFMVLFVSSPFVNDTNTKISAFLEDNTLSINEIGTIHQYKNKFSLEFVQAKELYEYVSSDNILESFKYYDLLEASINEIENKLTDIYDDLHEDSKDLLRNEKTVNKLIEEKEGKYIIDLILKIEKKHENFDYIKNKRNYIIDNIGFIKIMNSDFYEKNDYMILKTIDEYEVLKENFVTKNSLNKFNIMVDYYKFYSNNKESLQSIAGLNDVDIYTYQQKLNNIFSNNSLIYIYINDFNIQYGNSDNLLMQKLCDLFNQVIKYKDKFLEIDENMNFASRFVFAKNYNNWFVNQEWLYRPLVNGYFNDALLNVNSNVNLLFKEILFVSLLPEYNLENTIDNNDIDVFVNNLNTLIAKNILYSRDSTIILNQLLVDNLFIDKLLDKELISFDTVQYAKGLIV
ncbi:MAG: hypothetical protein WCR64_04160 [Bacilli bacterium]|nr:hypothetical protein [Bacilli bacterium]MDY0363115.1 hypothetical protein [Bacilli bacterium]